MTLSMERSAIFFVERATFTSGLKLFSGEKEAEGAAGRAATKTHMQRPACSGAAVFYGGALSHRGRMHAYGWSLST
jgi:hypothetical protein